MLACKALAALLTYPDAELMGALPEITRLLRDAGLPPGEAEAVAVFCDRLAGTDLMDAQSEYVSLFDRSPSLSLYLFEHVHGDSRERGQAMLDLAEDYRRAGLDMRGGELPDFLPVFLEYVSLCPADQGRDLLGEIADVVALLAARLRKRGSGYATVMRAIEALSVRSPTARPWRRGSGRMRRTTPRPRSTHAGRRRL